MKNYIARAWENQEILCKGLINELCNQGRFKEAEKWESDLELLGIIIKFFIDKF